MVVYDLKAIFSLALLIPCAQYSRGLLDGTTSNSQPFPPSLLRMLAPHGGANFPVVGRQPAFQSGAPNAQFQYPMNAAPAGGTVPGWPAQLPPAGFGVSSGPNVAAGQAPMWNFQQPQPVSPNLAVQQGGMPIIPQYGPWAEQIKNQIPIQPQMLPEQGANWQNQLPPGSVFPSQNLQAPLPQQQFGPQQPFFPSQSSFPQQPIPSQSFLPQQPPTFPAQQGFPQQPFNPSQSLFPQRPYFPSQQMPPQQPFNPSQSLPPQQPYFPSQPMFPSQEVLPMQPGPQAGGLPPGVLEQVLLPQNQGYPPQGAVPPAVPAAAGFPTNDLHIVGVPGAELAADPTKSIYGVYPLHYGSNYVSPAFDPGTLFVRPAAAVGSLRAAPPPSASVAGAPPLSVFPCVVPVAGNSRSMGNVIVGHDCRSEMDYISYNMNKS